MPEQRGLGALQLSRQPGVRAALSDRSGAYLVRVRTPVILTLYAALIVIRMPQIVLTGRFWAEEGPVFFKHAWDMPVWTCLWESYGGYLNLIANLAAILARVLMPLALAPYVTIAAGLLFQLFPPLLILGARDPWLQPWRVKIAAILLLLFMPGSEEIWLQSLHCQFELALCCGIILALEPEPSRGWSRVLALSILVLAPLCGPASIALCPLFMVRAVIDRGAARCLQAAAITFSSLAQGLFFMSTTPGRAYALHPVINLSVLTLKHLAIPFLGLYRAEAVNDSLRAAFASGHVPVAATILPVLIFVPVALAVSLRGLRYPGLWLFAGFVLTASVSYFGAIGGGIGLLDVLGNQRYAIVPQLLLELSLLVLASTSRFVVALLPSLAVAWIVAVGVSTYRDVAPGVSDGAPWRPEVTAWQADPHHVLQIWPQGWSMVLGSTGGQYR